MSALITPLRSCGLLRPGLAEGRQTRSKGERALPSAHASTCPKTSRRSRVVCLVALSLAGTVASAAVRTWTGTLTLPTYAWHDDPNPVFAHLQGPIYYPYTRQDAIDHVPENRTYRALFLENEYLRVTCLPELGGRIHSVFDKTTGEEMFHKNQEIKPALIAMRGAWISGGIEWNVGPQGHTVTIVSPVDALVLENEDGSATLVVGNTEKMFRTRWTIRLTLHPGKAYLDESVRIFNPSDGVHPYYFWNCTAFPNLPGTRFIYPMTLGSDHNGTSFFRWPIHEGKDLTWLRNYETMTSVFAYACDFDFFGAYDVDHDRGIVSYANHHEVRGKKAWTWGKDDFGVNSQMSLSDAGPVGAQYIEVQSGPLLTQADYGMLKPRQEVSWREFWYPVHGLRDGFEYATRDVAIQTRRSDGRLELRLLSTDSFPDARCTLTHGDVPLVEQPLDLSPADAESIILESPPEGPVAVSVRAADGSVLASYTTPLEIPHVEPPDLAKTRARLDGVATVDELFEEAALLDSQSKPRKARAAYETVLELDPGHVPSRCALAVLDIELGRFETAAVHARKALERDEGHGEGSYLLGVCALGQGTPDEAIRCGYRAAQSAETRASGYNLAARAHMRLSQHDQAVDAFARAGRNRAEDSQNRNQWLIARFVAGEREAAATEALALVEYDDPTDFVLRALVSLGQTGTARGFVEDVHRISGEKVFTVTETALCFADLGRFREARLILEALCAHAPSDPMPWYYLAYFKHVEGDESGARATLVKAANKSQDTAFPSRLEAEPALRHAIASQPQDGLAHLLLGYLCASLDRIDEAVSAWERAVALEPNAGEAWRLLGYHAWKEQGNLPRAEKCYRQAVAAHPHDQTTLLDLAEVLADLNRREEAIRLIEVVENPRHDLALWRARAYVDEGRLDDCIAFLTSLDIKNPEGSSEPRDIWMGALMARGKDHYEAAQMDLALADFEDALTYPGNLQVGRRYRRTDAETCYWLGKTYWALGQRNPARAAWEAGSAQITTQHPQLSNIHVTKAQDDYVQRCTEALKALERGDPQLRQP